MQIEVAAMAPASLRLDADGESSAAMSGRVVQAFDLQLARQDKSNQRLSTREIDHFCRLDDAGEQLLRAVMSKLHWSARAYHRVLKVARTIADLAAAAEIAPQHLAEAIQYRRGLRER